MSESTRVRPPAWFWVVAVLVLAWNLFGVAMFFVQYGMTPQDLAALPGGQRELFQAMPGWLWVVYGIATDTGALGSILLLIRNRLSVPLFWVSLVAVLVQFGYSLFPGRAIEVLGAAQALPMPVLIVAVAAAMVWFARRARSRGWIAGTAR